MGVKRRAHGAGSLTHLGDDRWRSRVRLPNGRRSDKTIRAATQKDAERIHRRRLVAADAGDLEHQTRTVADLIDEWRPTLDLAPYTLRNYDAAIEKWIRPELGAIRLDKLTGHDLHRMYQRMATRPHAARQVHAALSNALGQAVRWGWVRVNVAKGNAPRKPTPRSIDPPTPDDVIRLIDAALGPEMSCFLRLVATTGMRRGEACALTWRDVDLKTGEITVRHSVVKLAGSKATRKGTKTNRTHNISIGPGTVNMLREHHARMAARAKACGAIMPTSAYLFSGDPACREPWDPRVVTMRFSRLRTRLGLHGVRLHDLRHYAATEMIARGVNARTAADRLGHSDPSMTLKMYAHAIKAQDQAAGAMLDDLVPMRSAT